MTIKTMKRVMINMSLDDVRILETIMKQTGDPVNVAIKKALMYYQIMYLDKDKKKSAN